MNTPVNLFALVLALALPLSAQAHKAWLLPSETVLSGDDPWITVDAAVSNDLFYFNHVPLRLDALSITGPDGKAVQAENSATGKFRSTFDVHLTAPGTYRIAVVNAGLFANWEEDGKPKRWRGNAESFAKEVPKEAKNLKVSQSAGRVETFVTARRPNDVALKPTGIGQPVPNLAVEIIPDGIRYRDKQNEMSATTDKDGRFSVTWPNAGRYWLEAKTEDDKTSIAHASQRRVSYAVTLEVLPQ